MAKFKFAKISVADLRKYRPEVIGHCPTDSDYAYVTNGLLTILEAKSCCRKIYVF